MILPPSAILSLRVGDAFDHAGVSSKAAYPGTAAQDIAIVRLLVTLSTVPLRRV